MFRPSLALTLTLAAAAVTGGCYSPGGGFMSHTGGPQTWTSNEMMQKTITMVDLRSNEVFFTIDIPPGKQLVVDFDEGEGDDPVYTPDLMRYAILDQGTKTGKLRNAMTVPNAASRRVEVTLHRGVQYTTAPPELPLRTDQAADRPDWWTPEGGPMPESNVVEMYDN